MNGEVRLDSIGSNRLTTRTCLTNQRINSIEQSPTSEDYSRPGYSKFSRLLTNSEGSSPHSPEACHGPYSEVLSAVKFGLFKI
jgi:hypothetical protein